MRANTQTTDNTKTTTTRKTWHWNAELVQAEQARAEQVRNAQRRFRSA